jgi:hypothetical protein
MLQLLQHLSPPVMAVALVLSMVYRLLRPVLLAAIRGNSTRKRVEILVSGAVCVAVLMIAVWIASRLVAPPVQSSDRSAPAKLSQSRTHITPLPRSRPTSSCYFGQRCTGDISCQYCGLFSTSRCPSIATALRCMRWSSANACSRIFHASLNRDPNSPFLRGINTCFLHPGQVSPRWAVEPPP